MDAYFLLDIAVFVGFFILVIGVGIGMSRGDDDDSEEYFLAGRGLSWWLIGFSLIAANISSEQFIGMSGQAAMHVGLAIASYEWMAAVTLVVVAFFFLPRFLRAGIYTIPEFLEYRFTRGARSLMSALMVLICVLVSFTAVVYSGALTAEVLFADTPIFGFEVTLTTACWIIGALSAVYVVAGGLKACAWADLIQGASLIVGGAIVTYLAFQALGDAPPEAIGLAADQAAAGPIERFTELNRDKLHMKLPASDLILPWTALLLGLWIPNFYYWGLNQYITQRTLGAQSVAAGQRGVVFAAALKLIIPFIIVIPGIIAFNLYSGEMKDRATPENQATLDRFNEVRTNPATANVAFAFNGNFAELHRETAAQMLAFNRAMAGIDAPRPNADADLAAENDSVLKRIAELNRDPAADRKITVQSTLVGYKHDAAFPLLMKNLVFDHPGIRAFVVAALYGAVISSLAAVLNAASTLFTMDLYRQYINRAASQANLVATGRLCVVTFTIIGCLLAPQLSSPEFKGIFTYIQEFQGFFSPGVLAVFLFGLFIHRAPRICGLLGLLITPPVYAFLKWGLPLMGYDDIAFLNRMAITFGVDLVVLVVATLVAPLSQPVTLPEQTRIAVDTSAGARLWGVVIILVTAALYWFFW